MRERGGREVLFTRWALFFGQTESDGEGVGTLLVAVDYRRCADAIWRNGKRAKEKSKCVKLFEDFLGGDRRLVARQLNDYHRERELEEGELLRDAKA